MSLASIAGDVAKFIAQNPEIATNAVKLAQSLIEGKSGARELGTLKRSADMERERRLGIAAIARKR